LKDLIGEFVIPAYQRGYRWTNDQIETLLMDISAFAENGVGGFYFLSPIVVARRRGVKPVWEVVDGQQRLTTIYLINIVLSKICGALREITFSLSHESRLGSTDYLRDLARHIDDDLFINLQLKLDKSALKDPISSI
jgi:uncharacterized protein with ParB-like and HNH nuclease domain